MGKFIKWLAIGAFALIVLIIGAGVALPYLVPLDDIVAEGTAQVEKATGRKLVVSGKPDLSIWPEVSIKLGKTTFANAKGAPDANMASVEEVRIAVPVMPLISGSVEIKEFVLVKPDIRLYVDKSGKPNWDFGGAKAEGGASSGGGGKAALPEELKNLTLGDVRIEGGRVSYTDAKAGTTEVLENVNLALTLPSLNGPLGAEGDLVWKAEKIALELGMAKPLAAIEAGKSDLNAKVSGTHLDLSFDGAADFAKGFALAGATKFKTPSIKNLAGWAATPIAIEGDVLGPFEADGQFSLNGSRIAFTGASIAIDALRGKGDFAFNGGGKVPAIDAKLALGPVDLNPYIPVPAEGQTKSAGASGPGKWSEDKIDFSGFRQVNAKLDFTMESLLVQKIKIGESALKATLNGGKLDLGLTKLALYGGAGTGKVTLDASGKTPRIAKSFNLKGISAEPLLTDAADFERLEGKGDLNISVTGAGSSQAAIVRSLGGSGGFVFRDGAIKGFNLAAMLRKVETAFLDSGASATQQTDFSELSGTFKINKGIVSNSDLFMASPLFRVTGKGTADMPKRTVDFRVNPKAVADARGQGGDTAITGIAVPVLITGPWHDVQFAPDLAGILTNLGSAPLEGAAKVAEGAVGAIKGVAEGGAKGIGGLLKDVTKGVGGSEPAKDTAPKSEPDANPIKQLKGLFGK